MKASNVTHWQPLPEPPKTTSIMSSYTNIRFFGLSKPSTNTVPKSESTKPKTKASKYLIPCSSRLCLLNWLSIDTGNLDFFGKDRAHGEEDNQQGKDQSFEQILDLHCLWHSFSFYGKS